MLGLGGRGIGNLFLKRRQNFDPLDGVDAQIGIERHVEPKHVGRIAGLLRDDCQENGAGVASWRCWLPSWRLQNRYRRWWQRNWRGCGNWMGGDRRPWRRGRHMNRSRAGYIRGYWLRCDCNNRHGASREQGLLLCDQRL